MILKNKYMYSISFLLNHYLSYNTMNKTLLYFSAIQRDGKQLHVQHWMELQLCLTYSSYINRQIPTTPAVNGSEKKGINWRTKYILVREYWKQNPNILKGHSKSKTVTHVNWCLGSGSTLTRCPGFFWECHPHCMVHHIGCGHTSQTHEAHPEMLQIFLTLILFLFLTLKIIPVIKTLF